MEAWCGSVDSHISWVVAGISVSCAFHSLAVLSLLSLALSTALSSFRRFRLLDRLGPSRSYLWSIPGSSEKCIYLQFGASLGLVVLHAAIATTAVGTTASGPYAPTTEFLAGLIWVVTAVIAASAYKRHDCIRMKAFAILVAVVYAVNLLIESRIFVGGYGTSPMQRRMRFVAALAGSVLAATFVLSEMFKPEESTASRTMTLNQALLENENGYDEEDAIDRDSHSTQPKRKRHRPWYSLLGYAAAYMWPDGVFLRVRAVACILLICIIRALNLIVPLLWKKVIDTFSDALSPSSSAPMQVSALFFPWVFMWLALWLFQGGGGGGGSIGLLANLRTYLWIPISQSSFRRASLDIFCHVLDMDHGWHLHRRTGEVLRVMDRGTASMQTFLGTVVFQIGPAVFDIAAAAVFLALKLNWWIAIIVFVTLSTYIPLTIWVTEWRGQFRRDLNAKDNARGARATDALLNYETVKLFHNEDLECRQYAKAIEDYQKVDFKLSASMAALNVLQSLIIWIGLAAGMVVITAGIAKDILTVGDAVLFVSLVQQLYGPLNWFGTYYRMIQTSMLDMEGIFDLLTTHPTINDPSEPINLRERATKYEVAFENVSFAYDGESPAPVLRNISCIAKGGGTTALVGETGSGKSSLLRLLLRFYDPTLGRVCIDGIDLRALSLDSLRGAVGVVPQDCVLFNDTIKYNIRYGRPDASDDEVIQAAEGACIAETIQRRFPLGYDTLVGERGLRLSGGEKQRVAFARALLKNPHILVLDEASSALDSVTESRIQETLSRARADRTVLVVAHRLSTIVNADQIVVLSHGEIVEVGTHEQLLEVENGHYARMWLRQAEAGGSRAASTPTLTSLVGDQTEHKINDKEYEEESLS